MDATINETSIILKLNPTVKLKMNKSINTKADMVASVCVGICLSLSRCIS